MPKIADVTNVRFTTHSMIGLTVIADVKVDGIEYKAYISKRAFEAKLHDVVNVNLVAPDATVFRSIIHKSEVQAVLDKCEKDRVEITHY
jgi:acylphosphatase